MQISFPREYTAFSSGPAFVTYERGCFDENVGSQEDHADHNNRQHDHAEGQRSPAEFQKIMGINRSLSQC